MVGIVCEDDRAQVRVVALQPAQSWRALVNVHFAQIVYRYRIGEVVEHIVAR